MTRGTLGIVVVLCLACAPSTAQGALLRDAFKSVEKAIASSATTCQPVQYGETCSSPVSTCTATAYGSDRSSSCLLGVSGTGIACSSSSYGTWAGTSDGGGCGVVAAGIGVVGCEDVTRFHEGTNGDPDSTSQTLECAVAGVPLPVSVPLDALP